MGTKGPSNRYGGTIHSPNKTSSISIGYQWARDFNRNTLTKHFDKHGTEMNTVSEKEYESEAVHFANAVDAKNYSSVVDYYGTTYKWDKRNGKLVEVTKDGFIISYRDAGKKFWYIKNRKGKKVWVKIKKI